MTISKRQKLAFMIFSLACLIAIGVCLICDFAVNKSMLWSGYVLASVLFGWFVVFPAILASRYRLVFSLISATIALLPFLYILEGFTPVGGWFTGLAAPVAVISVAACWIMLLVYRFLKVNRWFLSAIAVFLFGVVVSSSTSFYINRFLGESVFSLSNIISLFSCAIITVLLIIIGISKRRSQ